MPGRIVFEGVWKRFHRGPAHDSLRDLIPALAKRVVGRAPPEEELSDGDFWAVRDVSFEVLPGQALGIIGGNGAGKSTTLKLLTKILRPTRGTALVEGRVGALIEVSAGFHPDLSGRENIFLQGAIMGMPQRLIRERFDEIVDFSGISDFIDTPVKRYSSGMNARLGFSIAVHLEPEVMIIDEVLSVGDASFQGRAFDKIKQLTQGQIPVVMVSHQLDRVVELCTSCILLKNGEAAFHGAATTAVREYLTPTQQRTEPRDDLPIQLHTLTPTPVVEVASGGRAAFTLRGDILDTSVLSWMRVGIDVRNATNDQLVYNIDIFGAVHTEPMKGPFEVAFTLLANQPAGLYRLDAWLWDNRKQRKVGAVVSTMMTVLTPAIHFWGTHQLALEGRVVGSHSG